MIDEEAEDYDGWDETDTNVGDPELRKTRLCKAMCSTCVFRPAKSGRLLGISNARVRSLVEGAQASEGCIVCHATLGTATPAICRGFYDRYSTNALRMIGRLWGFVEIEPPKET